MPFTRFPDPTNNISNLANQPVESPSVLKQKFDEIGQDLKAYLNNTLAVELESTTDGDSGLDNIGMTPIGIYTNPQAFLEHLEADKTPLTGNHLGTWQGFNPVQTDPGIQSVVNSHTAQLANLAIDPFNPGHGLEPCKGDGSDDLVALQAIVNYAGTNKIAIRNYDATRAINISAPLYLDTHSTFTLHDVDLGGAKIVKTSNTLGIGSNVSGAVSDSYVVDAAIIIRHADDSDAYNIKIKNLVIGSTALSMHTHAIYAPRLARSILGNVKCDWSIYKNCFFSYRVWNSELRDIRNDYGEATLIIENDGTGTGGSTSLKLYNIVGTHQKHCMKLYGVSYSVVDIPLIDAGTDIAFIISSCVLTINSPSTEYLNKAGFLYIESSNVVINTPRCFGTAGVTVGELYLLNIQGSSSVIINGGVISNFESGTNALNFPVITAGGSSLTLNNVTLPTNGNSYDPLSSNSTKLTLNKNGINMNKTNGSSNILVLNGVKHGFGTAIPIDGTWAYGDIFNITGETYGQPIAYRCVTPGTPGTWESFLYRQTTVFATYARPALTVNHKGILFIDTTLAPNGKPIWWTGVNWVDSNGTIV